MGRYGVTSKLVWDGGTNISIPSEMGIPRADQLQGMVREQLSELAGRVCYDSVGSGRSSPDYHKHIKEVGHLSVYEHAHMTVHVSEPLNAMIFLNRPGLWVENCFEEGFRVTFNPRSILDWDMWSEQIRVLDLIREKTAFNVGDMLSVHAEQAYPMLVPPRERSKEIAGGYSRRSAIVWPQTDEEKWVSMFMVGSRGFSHELVRHGDRTGISQRCLAGDTAITMVNGNGHAMPSRKKNGPRTIQWLYERMQDPRLKKVVGKLKPRVLDEETGLFTSGKLVDVVNSGKKPCFHVTLADGYRIKCTSEHRIWTEKGWKTLSEIANPKVTDSGLVTWDREGALKVGVNGLPVVGDGLYRDVEWMRSRYESGLSDVEMAKECGASPQTVKAYRVRMGFKKRILRDFSGSPVQNKEWLQHHYRELGLPHGKIAKLAECSEAVVHNWCRKFGIQKTRREINLGREPWNKGKSYSHTKPYSPETIEKYRRSKLGPKNPQWKGGVFSPARRDFHTWAKLNKKTIFNRDGYLCLMCKRHSSEVPYNSRHTKNRRIEIHHILPLWNRPDLACEPWNMATVCWECSVKKLNGGRELQYAPKLLEAIKSPICYKPSERKMPHGVRKVKVTFKAIQSITYSGIIDTYDLVLAGPNHGFVGNGVVVHNSTRFVQENESEWIDHPLVQEFMASKDLLPDDPENRIRGALAAIIHDVKNSAREVYEKTVENLQPWLIARGVDKFTARKQARGAARGYLGNALSTELIFSASVGQWKRMLRMRACGPADAEIRAVFIQALAALKQSRYAADFENFSTVPASDGLGDVVVEKQSL
jgi:thymidylate synthase ThyX